MIKKISTVAVLLLSIAVIPKVHAGFVKTETLWPSNTIPVCFDELHWDEQTRDSYSIPRAKWKKWVIEGATKWQVVSNITFSGWGICQYHDKGLRVGGGAGQAFYLLGTELDGVHKGLGIRNSLPKKNKSNARAIITSLATREFGAALGFQFDDRGNPDFGRDDCNSKYRRDNCGDLYFGPYDFNSVFSDRKNNLTTSINPSSTDIRMAQFFYGASRTLDIPENGLPFDIDRAITSTSAFSRGWDVDKHIRVAEDINGDGFADIVAFGDRDVFTALGNGNGTFAQAKRAVRGFGHLRGWDKSLHIRTLADINGDGKKDLVVFGDPGVYTALSVGNGTFANPIIATSSFGRNTSGWQVHRHPIELADINGDGRADIIGFGEHGVYTALAKADGAFSRSRLATKSFAIGAGGWTQYIHFRKLGDINGDGLADIVGISPRGIYSSLSLGNGQFSNPRLVLGKEHLFESYTYDAADTLADVNNDGMLDIIDIGQRKISVYLANAQGGFNPLSQPNATFFNRHNDLIVDGTLAMADVNGDGTPDLVGIAQDRIYTSITNPVTGKFSRAKALFTNFSTVYGGWNWATPRLFADLNGDGKADVLGFGKNNAYVGFFNR